MGVLGLWSVIVSCTAVVVAALYAWKFFNWVWFRPKRLEKCLRQQGFRGNSYRLFFGDSKDMRLIQKEARSKPMSFSNDILPRVVPTLHQAVQKYGKKCIQWFGPRPTVVVWEPEFVREVFLKFNVFQKPPGVPAIRRISRGISTHETEKWSKHRKLMNPAFRVEKLKHMIPSFYMSCVDMMNKWDEILPDEGSCELDVWPYLQTLTSDVMSRTAFGSSYEEGRKLFELQREQARLIMEKSGTIYIPGWRFLPTKYNRRMKEILMEIESTVMSIINKRMKSIKSGEGSSNDLLGLLLESNLKEIEQHGNNFGMSIHEVVEECKLLYFAGHETPTSLLVWTMILLSKHTDWQSKARDEVLEVFGRRKPEYQELNHLKILNMTFYETMRLYPPVAFVIRMAMEEIKLGNLTLPAGVQLILPIILLHHDKKIWGDDVKEFNPERFGGGISQATRGQMTYLPFGGGPRICIGQNFAMLEAKMAMAMILQRYSFKLSPSYSHAPGTKIILEPQHGAHLILEKIKN